MTFKMNGFSAFTKKEEKEYEPQSKRIYLDDEYEVGDAPYLLDEIKTIPVYEKNTNVEVTLKSEHPSPATLRSLTWEGDYSPRNYRRV